MAGSPKYKIYTSRGEYVAACKYAEDAACVVGNQGTGATVKANGRIVYRTVEMSADGLSDSFDAIADQIMQTETQHMNEREAKYNA